MTSRQSLSVVSKSSDELDLGGLQCLYTSVQCSSWSSYNVFYHREGTWGDLPSYVALSLRSRAQTLPTPARLPSSESHRYPVCKFASLSLLNLRFSTLQMFPFNQQTRIPDNVTARETVENAGESLEKWLQVRGSGHNKIKPVRC